MHLILTTVYQDGLWFVDRNKLTNYRIITEFDAIKGYDKHEKVIILQPPNKPQMQYLRSKFKDIKMRKWGEQGKEYLTIIEPLKTICN